MAPEDQGNPDGRTESKNAVNEKMKTFALVSALIAVFSFSWMIKGEIEASKNQYIMETTQTRLRNQELSIIQLRDSSAEAKAERDVIRTQLAIVIETLAEIRRDLKEHSQ